MKKAINKYILTATIALGAMVGFSSCNDFLDRTPQGVSTDDEVTIESKVFNTYVYLRHYNVTAGIPAFAVHLYRSEDSEKGSETGDGADMADMYDDFNYITTSGSLGAYWEQNYKIIVHVNRTLVAIDEAEKLPKEAQPENLGILRGELKFFRAYAFFNLVRAFGEVPKLDFHVDDATKANIPKSSVDEIYKVIDADLIEATQLLPPTWGAEYEGRLTWGAARSFHARTYMMRGEWQKMYDAANEVIGTGIYNLNTPSDQVFTDEGELCGESVFEIVCKSTPSMPSSTKIGSQFAEVQGLRGLGIWDFGWGWHMGTELIGKAFEPKDPRKDATLLYFRRSATEAITAENTNKPWNESPISSGMGSYFNKKVYTNPIKRAAYSKFGHWVNIRLIRYSDVLLMGAEAANELGNTTDALKYLEQVRARARKTAGLITTGILPEVTTTNNDDLRDAIKHERRVELAFEFDRFYDLVRWGDAKKVLHAAGKTKYEDKHRYFPLPQVEIDKSNGVLVQNPDYGSK